MKSFTFQLPVKRYIQKYLHALYGETIPAEMETDIGYVILNTLASRLEAKVCRGYNNQFADPYPSTVTFTVPFHYFYLTKKELSVYTCILLNRYLENKFKQDLIIHIEISMARGSNYKSAIESFALAKGISIEEDISYDTLKKMADRLRKKNSELSLRSLSLTPNLFTRAAV